MISACGLQPFVVRFDPNVIVRWIEIGHLGVGKARAEFLGLLVHVHDQLRPVDSFGKAGKIFHQRGRGKLTARLAAFEHQRTQVRARGINRRGQPGATAPDNDHFLHA